MSTGKKSIIQFILALVLIIYFLQISSPMRLAPDSIVYLSMAASAVEGNGFYYAQNIPYPPGYPAMIALLDLVGLGVTWAIFTLSYMFLLLGIACSYLIFRTEFELEKTPSLILCLLSLLSLQTERITSMPLSDIPFFGITMSCLYMLILANRSFRRRRWFWILGSTVLMASAVSLRLAGISLLGPYTYVLLRRKLSHLKWQRQWKSKKFRIALWFFALLIILSALIIVFMKTHYFQMVTDETAGMNIISILLYMITISSREVTFAFYNVSMSRMPDFLDPVIILLGIATICILIWSVWKRKRFFGIAEFFIISYGLIVLLYPMQDPRLWLPVLSLLMCVVFITVKRYLHVSTLKTAIIAYIIWYIAFGIGALAYYTHIAFSGDQFPEFSSDKLTYRFAFGIDQSITKDEINIRTLKVLRRYEPRARTKEEGESKK